MAQLVSARGELLRFFIRLIIFHELQLICLDWLKGVKLEISFYHLSVFCCRVQKVENVN